MNIGEIIKRKRQYRNMTQADLAARLNVTPQAVSRWEMGVSYPDIAMIPKISKILFVTADELLGINPPYTDPNSEGDAGAVLNQSQADSIFDYISCPVSGESKKVLVADDSDFMRMMVEDILTHYGHNVLQAKDGQECINILHDETVDVCILDIGMPDTDGIDVLKKIKEDHPGLKVVMLSALSNEENVKLSLQHGADSFVVKPFQAQLLVERIG